MPSTVPSLIQLLADELAKADEVMENFNRIRNAVNTMYTDLTTGGYGATAHGDLSAVTTTLHTGSSVKLIDSGGHFTTDQVEAATQQLGSEMDTAQGDIIDLESVVSGSGMIKMWGISYHGRSINFTTGVYSGGSGAPTKPVTIGYSLVGPVINKIEVGVPAMPSNGDRYIIPKAYAGGGDWATHNNAIAQYSTLTSSWLFYPAVGLPPDKTVCLNNDDGKYWYYDTATDVWIDGTGIVVIIDIQESFNGDTATFSTAPFINMSALYNNGVHSLGSGSLVTDTTANYTSNVTTVGATFSSYAIGDSASCLGWFYWFAIGETV